MTQSLCTNTDSEEACPTTTGSVSGGAGSTSNTNIHMTTAHLAEKHNNVKVNTEHSNPTRVDEAMNTQHIFKDLQPTNAKHGLLLAQSVQGTGVKKKRSQIEHNGDIAMVTLASMDEVSDLGASTITEDSFNSGDAEDDMYLADHGDTDDEREVSSSDSDLLASTASQLRSGAITKSQPHLANGPMVASSPGSTLQRRNTDEHIVDVNENSTHDKSQTWVEQTIESRDDLERIFVQNVFCDSPNNENESAFDYREQSYSMVEFAEKYFNVHYISGGPASAISKTVNFVKRRPNQVGFDRMGSLTWVLSYCFVYCFKLPVLAVLVTETSYMYDSRAVIIHYQLHAPLL